MIENDNQDIKEAFEIEADEMGFCLDQYWGDSENPYENNDTALAFDLFKKGYRAASQNNYLPKAVIDSIKEMS
ncbi:hypothetical protein [Acinetobacter bereziniae]|uniref:hypothetical protein n=1 Tax=Acinetobacter bereziniae TaxID=106648 RepID=UPI000EF756EC|nr:hypothetical protein [Acinetobacter bereziniae]